MFGTAPDHAATSKLPQHGFARTSRWEFLGKSTSESSSISGGGDDSVKLDFGLSPSNLSEGSKKAWPFEFGLIYSVTLGRGILSTSMVVRNEGDDAWEFQTLMHTYFRVAVSYIILLLLIWEPTNWEFGCRISQKSKLQASNPPSTSTNLRRLSHQPPPPPPLLSRSPHKQTVFTVLRVVPKFLL